MPGVPVESAWRNAYDNRSAVEGPAQPGKDRRPDRGPLRRRLGNRAEPAADPPALRHAHRPPAAGRPAAQAGGLCRTGGQRQLGARPGGAAGRPGELPRRRRVHGDGHPGRGERRRRRAPAPALRRRRPGGVAFPFRVPAGGQRLAVVSVQRDCRAGAPLLAGQHQLGRQCAAHRPRLTAATAARGDQRGQRGALAGQRDRLPRADALLRARGPSGWPRGGLLRNL